VKRGLCASLSDRLWRIGLGPVHEVGALSNQPGSPATVLSSQEPLTHSVIPPGVDLGSDDGERCSLGSEATNRITAGAIP